MTQLVCQSCKKPFEWDLISIPIGRQDDCPNCNASLKVCLNCKHYDLSAQWECREHIREQVRDKDKANFCEEFSFKPFDEASLNTSQGQSAQSRNEALLKTAEALFKKLK